MLAVSGIDGTMRRTKRSADRLKSVLKRLTRMTPGPILNRLKSVLIQTLPLART